MGVPDHGPLIVGITWWLTFFCGGFLGLRIYAKLSRRQSLWWDDWILMTSWVLLLIEAILTQVCQVLGVGKRRVDIDPVKIRTLAFYISIGAAISCFASALSKISFGVTLLRLTTGKIRWSIWFCMVTLFLFMLPSAFVTWVQCTHTAEAWSPILKGHCWNIQTTLKYGIFNAAWCAAADFFLALLPWTIIWGLQMRTREKIGVGIAMSMGLLAGVCAIIKGVYLFRVHQDDFTYTAKDVFIWTGVETAVAIIGASIAVLRVFFKERVASYSSFRRRSTTPSTLKRVLTTAATARRSVALNTLASNRDIESTCSQTEPVEEQNGGTPSEMRSKERRGDEVVGVAVGGDGGSQGSIWQTMTITREIEERAGDGDGGGER